MRRLFLNIYRLPRVYLPSFISAVLVITLLLMCGSIRLSCEKAYEKLNSTYSVTLEITLKEQNERVLSDDGSVEIVNRNNRLIDSEVLGIISSAGDISDVEYITNSYSVPLRIICTGNEFTQIKESADKGKPFNGIRNYYLRENKVKYDISVIGCTDEKYIKEALNTDIADITYLPDNSFGSGALLPKELYEALGCPQTLIVGWYKTESSGTVIAERQSDGSYIINADIADYIKVLDSAPPPPEKAVDVAGYYESTSLNDYIFTNVDTWGDIYSAQDYYGTTENVRNYYRNDINAVNELGISVVRMSVSSPDKTVSVIKTLIDSGLDPDCFSIRADDFDYKFALSQVDAIKSFADTAYYSSAVFGMLILIILIYYTAGKRKNEIYTRRTLGESGKLAALRISGELSGVLLLGFVFGAGLCACFGGGVCEAINYYAQQSVNNTVANMSRVADFMVNNAHIKARLDEAVGIYNASEISISYSVPPFLYVVIAIAWLIISVCALAVLLKIASTDLMKKEQ